MEKTIETTTVGVSPKPKKFKPAYIILPLVLLAGGYFAYSKINHNNHYESTDNAQVSSNAIPVLSRVPGYIDSVMVSDFSEVKKGQLVLRLDNREYEIAVQQAEADLLQAQADLANARATISTIGASENVAAANASVLQTRLQKAEADLKRDEALMNDGAITRRQYEDSRNNVETARKQLIAGNQQTRQASVQNVGANAQIQKAQALIATRQAALEKAKLQASYSEVFAPASGRVGKTNLQPGQYIQPGQPLFTIVNNEAFWIVANFKETQLARLKLGQPVEIKIDGYPDKKFEGRITSFSEQTGANAALIPPDNASGNYVKVTQRVPVKIEFDNTPELKQVLKAGLSASVEVKVK